MTLGELIVRINGDTTGLDKALMRSSQAMKSAGKAMTNVGKQLTMGLTMPILGVGTAAFNMYKGFESSMAKINGLVGVSQKQVDAWSKEILEIGPSLGKAPKELADALFFVTSAGIKGAEAMDVLKSSAQASAAGLGETKVVADLVTSAMNAYGKENLSAKNATDILVASVREGKAEAPALAAALGQVLPIASEMGVSFDQVGASVAAMTRTGTEATTASMQLKNILASLLKPTDMARDALENMGTSASEMRRTIKEDGLITALSQLRKMTNEYGEEAMAEVFPNIRALSGVLDLMGSNAEDNIAIFKSLESTTGSLDKAFSSAADTAQFNYDKAISSVQTSLTTLGESVASAVTPIIEAFSAKMQALTKWFNGLTQAQKESAIKWAAFIAALGPALIIIGQLTIALSGLGTVLAALTGPIGWVVAAIAALGAAFIYARDNWDGLKERFSDINWWRNSLIEMAQFFIKYSPFSLMIEGFNALVEKFGGDTIPNPFEAFRESLDGLKGEQKEYVNELGTFGDAVKNTMAEVSGLLGSMMGGAGGAWAPVIPTSEQLEAVNGLNLALAENEELEPELDIIDVPQEQIDRLNAYTQSIKQFNQGVQSAINGAIVSSAEGIGQMMANFALGANGINTLGDLMKGVGSVVLGSLGDMAIQVGKMAIGIGLAVEGIKIALESLNPAVAIAAGVGLIALGSLVKAQSSKIVSGMQSNSNTDFTVQGLATGGQVTRGGQFMVGEEGPELVNLPAGAAVTPNHMLGAPVQQLIAKVSARELHILLTQYSNDIDQIT